MNAEFDGIRSIGISYRKDLEWGRKALVEKRSFDG
jgi:hypothetical protein